MDTTLKLEGRPTQIHEVRQDASEIMDEVRAKYPGLFVEDPGTVNGHVEELPDEPPELPDAA